MANAIVGMDKSGSFRVYLAITTKLVETARSIHDTTPLASAGLGRVLTGAGLMGLLLKNKSDKLTVQFKGDGPAKQILATAFADGTVKGYIANPDCDLPLKENGKLDVGGSLGIGELTVIKDIGLKEPYVGKIALVTGEIADDLTAYYFISEQQNSSIALGVKVGKDLRVSAAGGMVIQMLPNAAEASVDALEELLDKLEPMTTLIEKVERHAAGLSEEGLVEALMHEIFDRLPEEFQVDKLEERNISWNCGCSKERFAAGLSTIGKKDMKQIIDEDGKAEIVCQFCRKVYEFNKQDLEEILESM